MENSFATFRSFKTKPIVSFVTLLIAIATLCSLAVVMTPVGVAWGQSGSATQWDTECEGVVQSFNFYCGVSLREAGSLELGPRLTAENLDSQLDETLSNSLIKNLSAKAQEEVKGRTIESMLPAPLKRMIKKEGFRIQVGTYNHPQYDPRYNKATQVHGTEATYNPETRKVTGYKAGVPFPTKFRMPDNPQLTGNEDPEVAANKVVYNYWLAHHLGHLQNHPIRQVFKWRKDGLDRVQHGIFQRPYQFGALTDEAMSTHDHTLGDGKIYSKLLQFLTYPQSIRGVGNFTIRYRNGELDDKWAYVRSIRRVRRLTGATWSDPLPGGADGTSDDLGCYGAHPRWYKSFRLIDHKWMLMPYIINPDVWKENAQSVDAEYPTIDFKGEFSWDPSPEQTVWIPSPAWVVEAVPPDFHPYSKKIIYFDAKNWKGSVCVGYSREDPPKPWRFITHYNSIAKKMDRPVIHLSGWHLQIWDLKSEHSTTLFLEGGTNTPGVRDKIGLDQLRRSEPATP